MRSRVEHKIARPTKVVFCGFCVFVSLALAGCPSLPPPAPRARAHVVSIERSGDAIVARLAVERDGEAATVTAVDWEISRPGGPPLLRGRSPSLEVTIAMPAALATAQRVRLRGAIHLREGRAAATFDDVVRLRPIVGR